MQNIWFRTVRQKDITEQKKEGNFLLGHLVKDILSVWPYLSYSWLSAQRLWIEGNDSIIFRNP